MTTDLLARLERAYTVLKAADMVQRQGWGITRHEWAQRGLEATGDGSMAAQVACGTGRPKGLWYAYAAGVEAFDDDPTTAVIIVEQRAAKHATESLRENQALWSRKAAECSAALVSIETLITKDPTT